MRRATSRIALASLAALLALLCTAAAPSDQRLPCVPRELLTKFGDWSAESQIIDLSIPVQSVAPATADGRPADAIRLLIAAPRAGAAPWQLAIRNSEGHLLELIDRSAFPDAQTTVWSERLDGPSVTVGLRGGDATTQVEVRGAMAIPKPGEGERVFSIKGATPDWQDLYPTNSRMLRDVGETVGILSAGRLQGMPPQRQSWCCTGVMIGPNLFMTNWHCGGGDAGKPGFDEEVKSGAIVDLEWEKGAPARRQFNVVGREFSSEALDFAILRVRPIVGPHENGASAVPVSIAAVDASPDQAVFMIHHAMCQPKQISTHCRVVGTAQASWIGRGPTTGPKPELTHDCDSEPGASGAPIFNQDGQLVALHHLGFSNGAQCPSDHLNKAVKVSAIVQAVRSAHPELARELGW